MSEIVIRPGSESPSVWAWYEIPAASKAARVVSASLVSSMSSPSVSSAMPTIPAMFTPRSASAVAMRASAPGRSSSFTVNQTDTHHLLSGGWYLRRSPCRYAPIMAASGELSVQIFGHDRDPGTRAAVRFFKERRVAIHQVDLTRKPIARGELRRFVDRLGSRALLDESSRAYREGGLAYLRMDDAEINERLLAMPALLRIPLVRFGNDVSAGRNEEIWKAWIKRGAT